MRNIFTSIYFTLLVWFLLFMLGVYLFEDVLNTPQKLLYTALLGLGVCFTLFYFNQKNISLPKAWLEIRIKELYTGIPSKKARFQLPQHYQSIQTQFEKLEDAINTSNESLKKMARGEEMIHEISHASKVALHQHIIALQQSLNEQNKASYQTQWYRQGYALLSDVLRQSTTQSPQALAQDFLETLAKYFQIRQAAIYWLEETENDKQILALAAAHAYPIEKLERKYFETQEGLIGACFTKKKIIILEQIPENYATLHTAIGKINANALIIHPIQKEGQIIGVLELIANQTLPKYQLELLEVMCDNYAITLQSQQMYIHTEQLLRESQHANKQLQLREAQMSKNAAQLEQMQSMLSERIQTIEEETNLLQNIIEAIDKTNATIEFDMEGNILEVNKMYLSVVGYKHEELVGKNEMILVPKDDITSGRYDMIWDSLKQGAYLSGEYRRITQAGKEVWLESTYNPIFDTDGVPFKVIQLAQFTTEDKERSFEQNAKLNALGMALPIIELNEESQIVRINAKFTETLGYERKDIRKKVMQDIILDEKTQDGQSVLQNIWTQVWKGNTQSHIMSLKSKTDAIQQYIIYFNPIMKLDGKIDKILTILIDVTEIEGMRQKLIHNEKELSQTIQELHNTTANLHQQNQEFDTVVSMFHQACKAFELDSSFKILTINENLQNKLSLEPQTSPTYFEQLIDTHFPTQYWEECKEKLQSNSFHSFTMKYRSPASGKSFWGNTSIAVYRDFEKNQTRYLGIIIDVTDDVVQAVYLRGEIVELKMKNAILKYRNTNKNIVISEDKLIKNALEVDKSTLHEMISHELFPSIRADKNENILVANSLVYDLLGFPKETLTGTKLSHILSFKNQEEQQSYQEWILRGEKEEKRSGIQIINNKKGNGLYANTAFIHDENGFWLLFIIL